VKLGDEPCPCGRPYRTLAAIDGREEDILTFEREGGGLVEVHPNRFHEALERASVDAWQVERTHEGLIVRLVGRKAAAEAPGVSARIGALLAAAQARPPRLSVVVTETLKRGASGKAPLVLCGPAGSPA